MKINLINVTVVNRFAIVFVSLVVFVSQTGCFHRLAPASANTATYNETANTTNYNVSPYGSILLPGKWETGKYAKTSRQQYFYRSDTTTLIVAIGPCSNYEFGKGNVKDAEFLNSYYNMEANYQIKLQDQNPVVLVTDTEARYKIWKVHEDGIDQYYLCGTKDCDCKECTYRTFTLKNRKISQTDAVALLKQVFETSK